MSKELVSKGEAARMMEEWKEDITLALPHNITYDRMRSTFITAVAHNPEILKCDQDSIRTALLKCANDRLMPDNREAALVPYNTNVAKANEKPNYKLLCQYLPMVLGIRKRAKELGGIKKIVCEVVRQNDFFDRELGDDSKIVHKPPQLGTDRGDIIGAYSIFYDDNDDVLHRETMDRSEIEEAREVSRAKNGPAWTKFYSEMARKTVLRRGAKSIPSMPDELRTIIERDDEMTDFQVGSNSRTIDANANPLLEDNAGRDRVQMSNDRRESDKQPNSRSSGNRQESSKSSANSSQQSGKDEDGGGQVSVPRMEASVFEEYSTALLRYSSEGSVDKGAAQFWKGERPFEENAKDDKLARTIFDLHIARAKGDLASDEMQKNIAALIKESYAK